MAAPAADTTMRAAPAADTTMRKTLQDLGLHDIYATLAAEEIDDSVFCDLQDDDLKELYIARQPPQDPHRDRGAQGARARRLAPAAAAAAAVAVARAGAVGRDAAAVASAPRGGGGRGVQHLHGLKRRGANRGVRPHDVLVVRVGLVGAHAGRPTDGVPHLPR